MSQIPRSQRSNGTDILKLISKYQQSAAMVYDAWNKKRYHKSRQKDNVLKPIAQPDSTISKTETTATLFYDMWNMKKRHQGV